jgi:hypothetical protein
MLSTLAWSLGQGAISEPFHLEQSQLLQLSSTSLSLTVTSIVGVRWLCAE